MNLNLKQHKDTRLFIILGGFFIANAVVAEMIGGKIFALEATLGLQPINWNLFGQTGSLQLSAGVVNWPIVFIMTDIINEYFGGRGVRLLTNLTIVLITYSFLIIFAAMNLAPAEFWRSTNVANGVPDMQLAFSAIFGQGLWIILGSLTAFLFGQVLDVFIFHKIKQVTGEKYIWLRSTGSTLFSQLIDSFLVLYIAFVLGPQHWSISLFLAVGTVNYLYKSGMAVLLTPVIYIVHEGIERYLGKELAEKMRAKAALGTKDVA